MKNSEDVKWIETLPNKQLQILHGALISLSVGYLNGRLLDKKELVEKLAVSASAEIGDRIEKGDWL